MKTKSGNRTPTQKTLRRMGWISRLFEADRVTVAAMVGLLALIVRTLYLYESSDNPTFFSPIADAYRYSDLATRLLEQGQFTREYFLQPFFYPVFLSLVFFFTHSSVLWTKIIQALLGSVTCAMTYLLGESVFNRKIGLIAGCVTALYGPLIFFETDLLATGWAAFWSVALILLLLKAAKNENLSLFFILGCACTLSILTRPTFLPFCAVVTVWLIWRLFRQGTGLGRIAVRFGVLVAGFLVFATPIAFLSERHIGTLTILPTSGGINLYLGNHPDYAGNIGARRGYQWKILLALPYKEAGIKGMKEGDRFFCRKTQKFMKQEPGHFLRGLFFKAWQFNHAREIPNHLDIYLFREWSWMLKLLVWKIGGFGFPFGIILPFALIGLGFRWRTVPFPVVVYLALYSLSIILVFVCARFRIPVIPLTVLLASVGFFEFLKLIRKKQMFRIAMSAAIIMAATIPMIFSGSFDEETYAFKSELYLYLGIGSYYNSSRDPDKAARLFTRAIALNPDNGDAHYYLGNVFGDLGNPSKAEEQYRQAIIVAPDHADAHYNLGRILAGRGDLDEALRHFSAAVRFNPLYAMAYNNMGNVLVQMGRHEEAVAYYKKAIEIQPDLPETCFNLGMLSLHLGRIKESIAYFSKLLAMRPDDADALYYLGDAWARQGQEDEAMSYYGRAVEAQPRHAMAHYKLGVVLEGKGRIKEAIGHLVKTVRIMPQFAEAHMTLGRQYWKIGDRSSADKEYEILRDLNGGLADRLKKWMDAEAGSGGSANN